MKILELHYSTAAAGAERLVIDLSNELSRNNELVLCTTDDDSILENSYYKNEISARIKYINLNKPKYNNNIITIFINNKRLNII